MVFQAGAPKPVELAHILGVRSIARIQRTQGKDSNLVRDSN